MTVRRAAAFVAVLGLASCVHVAHRQTGPIPYELWYVGLDPNDAVTRRFLRELSPSLTHATGLQIRQQPTLERGALLIWLREKVRLEEGNDPNTHVRLRYRVELRAANGQPVDRAEFLAISSGTCWADQLDKCMGRIASDARRAARRLPRSEP